MGVQTDANLPARCSTKAGIGITSYMRKPVVLSLALLASLGHAQVTGYYSKGAPDVAADDVSLIQLIANPQAYDGKTIRIIGFVNLEFEGNVIYLHADDFRHGLTRNGLWIDLPRDMTPEQIKAVNDHYVVCTAKFIAGMHGHMGMNSGEVANVTRLQVWPAHRATPQPEPTPN